MARPRLLICSQEPLGEQITGPGIRVVELAAAARAVADVVVAAPAGGDVAHHPHDPGPLRAALRDADVLLTGPLWPRHVAAVRAAGVPWVCDLYVPEPLETLEHFRDRPRLRRLMNAFAVDRTEDALARAALVLCASERQRDLLTGALLAARSITPTAYDADPTLGDRIAILPFGVPDAPPAPAGHPLRERFGIAADATVVLWNGGTWPWLDPAAAERAVLAQPRDVHLVFMGGADARVTPGPRVHVNTDWVPYAARGGWLLDADVVISAHHDHLETRFSYRTRLLDALWAGLPIVCAGGDDLAALVEREDLGAVGDLERGLARVLAAGPASYAPRIAAAAAARTWSRVAEPLLAFLGDPAPPPRGRRLRAAHPARAARSAGYRAARPVLDRIGLREWPRAA